VEHSLAAILAADAVGSKTFDGARDRLSEQRLQLGEGSLDRVEVGPVGRQISGKRPSRAS
jgi:hypothetical protein